LGILTGERTDDVTWLCGDVMFDDTEQLGRGTVVIVVDGPLVPWVYGEGWPIDCL
jgi:hypothetical protein